MKNNEDMALLVIGFDGYSDLWDDYFTLLNKYWPDRKYKTYLANNTLRPSYENVNVINCGPEAEWSLKVQTALSQIEEKYVCLLLEDFYVGKKIDSNLIDNVLGFIQKENIKYYKLNTFTKFRTKRYKGLDYLHEIPENFPYGISLLPSIWKKDFLLELVGTENYNAWVFEFDRVKESENTSKNPLLGCVFDKRNILNVYHGVVQGKYLPYTVKFFEKQNYHLNMEKRTVMTPKVFYIYQLKVLGMAIVPIRLLGLTKKILKLVGMRFVSDKHRK